MVIGFSRAQLTVRGLATSGSVTRNGNTVSKHTALFGSIGMGTQSAISQTLVGSNTVSSPTIGG